jgi:hypothetical protein
MLDFFIKDPIPKEPTVQLFRGSAKVLDSYVGKFNHEIVFDTDNWCLREYMEGETGGHRIPSARAFILFTRYGLHGVEFNRGLTWGHGRTMVGIPRSEKVIYSIGELLFDVDRDCLYVGDGETPGGVILC